MRPLYLEREKATELRKKGYTYRDILNEIPVAKSTLSLWLKDTPLTEIEKRLLKWRGEKNISRGRVRAAASLRQLRKDRDKETYKASLKEFQLNKTNPLFQLGIGLYWAEGAKRSSSFAFTNSDPNMIRIMIFWIEKFLGIRREEIKMRLYVHKPYVHEDCESYWSKESGIPLKNFGKTILKPSSGLQVKKRPNYKGCVRVEIGPVKYLRKLLYWQKMLIEHY